MAVCVQCFCMSFLQTKCIPAAVQCFQMELEGVVKTECEDPGRYVDDALEFLDMVKTTWLPSNIDNEVSTSLRNNVQRRLFTMINPICLYFNTQATTSECRCELWPQESFHNYLEKMKSLIELISPSKTTM